MVAVFQPFFATLQWPARPAACLLGLIAVFATATSLAQTAAQTNVSPDHVTFYSEPNYRGDALTVEAGASVADLERMLRPQQQPWSFAISSVRIAGAAKATVYSSAGFGGDRLEITRSIPDLYSAPRGRDRTATWDRAIMSAQVTGPQRVPPPPVQHEAAPPHRTVVVVPAPPPPVVVHEVRPRLDRRSADLIVHRAYREVLDRSPDPEGLHTYRDRLIHEGWSERKIIQQLQRSEEARSINADEAIAKAYREMLGRDPDPNGLAHYRSKWRDGWTQGQIRDDLRRSTEGRATYIRNVITRAYRELLGREPDPGGYATYEKAMRERGYTERDVRAAIMSGDEYRQRPGKGRQR